jgi:hypothetical protein
MWYQADLCGFLQQVSLNDTHCQIVNGFNDPLQDGLSDALHSSEKEQNRE